MTCPKCGELMCEHPCAPVGLPCPVTGHQQPATHYVCKKCGHEEVGL